MATFDPTLNFASRLRPGDLPDAMKLVTEAGWNQTVEDWRVFLDLGTVYTKRTKDGRVVATAATLFYGRFAWISMVLVSSAFQRRGLAQWLMRKSVTSITASGAIPALDATPAGREVYRRLGFEDAWGYQRYARKRPVGKIMPSAPPNGISIQPVDPSIWQPLRAYDAKLFGADRGDLLERLYARLPYAAFVAVSGDRLVGFILGRDGRTAHQLGPLVAENDAIAEFLLTRALQTIEGPIFIDVPNSKSNIHKLLGGIGFKSQRPLMRMLYRCSISFNDTSRTYAVVGPEFG